VQLSEVPLELRCAAAVEVIWRDAALGVRKRRELLATAIWPNRLPPRQPMPAALAPAPIMTTDEKRAWAREAFQTGATIQEVAAELDVAWMTARGWVRASR
jgi:hypothetical protein